MKSKEEIFERIYKESDFTYPDRSLIHKAMDQYSEQIAIGFAEWIAENARAMYDHKMKLKFWVIGSGLNEEIKSTTELYNLYKQTLK